jgi:hypothetical protein
MSATLQLNCWVFDNHVNQVFLVKIMDTESVGTLKQAIEEMKLSLHHISADTLTLWKVSFPVNHNFQQSIANLDLTNETSLSSVDDLFEVFSDVTPHKNLHIIVKPHVGE